MGPDASIYFTTSDKKLFCIDSSGDKRWEAAIAFNGEGAPYSPVILKDGSILAADIGCLYSFNSNGIENWRFSYSFLQTPNINVGKDGTIYIIGDFNTLLAISPQGQLLWKLQEPSEGWSETTAISVDGKTLYLTGTYLYSINLLERKINWKSSFKAAYPMADVQGNVYCLSYDDSLDSPSLLSINKDGEVNWQYKFKDAASTLTMDKNGNIYFGDFNVYSVSYEGKLNWKLNYLNDWQPLMCDNLNNLYSISSQNHAISVNCISESGAVLWNAVDSSNYYSSGWGAALGFNQLIVPGYEISPIYKIK